MMRLFAYMLCALLVGATAARAQPTDERAIAAKQRYENGMAHFQLEEWDRAISEWEEGFRQKPVPQFLYNIAQANRLSKRYEKALSFYQKYLRMEPKAVNKAEVDRHIASLTRLIGEQQKASSSPPVQPLPTDTGAKSAGVTPRPRPEPVRPAPEPVRPAPVVTPEPAPVAVTPASEPARADLTASPRDKPIHKKGWFWGVVVGGAAIVIGAVVLGVVLGTADNTRVLSPARF